MAHSFIKYDGYIVVADKAYIRFVNDQRVHVRSLLAELEKSTTAASKKTFFCAAARAAELALVGYFAELTQKRFQMPFWQKLLQGDRTFAGLHKHTHCDIALIAFWLDWETALESPLYNVRLAIEQLNSPTQESYQQGLLAQTSLVDSASRSNLIASSAITTEVKSLCDKEFAKAWVLIESQMLFEREQALEC